MVQFLTNRGTQLVMLGVDNSGRKSHNPVLSLLQAATPKRPTSNLTTNIIIAINILTSG
jgi:hypothetical protein